MPDVLGDVFYEPQEVSAAGKIYVGRDHAGKTVTVYIYKWKLNIHNYFFSNCSSVFLIVSSTRL